MNLLIMLAQNDGADAAATAGGMAAFFGFFCCIGIVVIASLGLTIWAVIDAAKNPRLTDNERLVWILLSIFVNPIGPILYFVIGKKK